MVQLRVDVCESMDLIDHFAWFAFCSAVRRFGSHPAVEPSTCWQQPVAHLHIQGVNGDVPTSQRSMGTRSRGILATQELLASMPFVTVTSNVLLFLVVGPGVPLVASLLPVAMPFVTSNVLLFLVVRPGAPLVASLLPVAMPFVTSNVLLFLVVRPGAPLVYSVLAPSSDALCSE